MGSAASNHGAIVQELSARIHRKERTAAFAATEDALVLHRHASFAVQFAEIYHRNLSRWQPDGPSMLHASAMSASSSMISSAISDADFDAATLIKNWTAGCANSITAMMHGGQRLDALRAAAQAREQRGCNSREAITHGGLWAGYAASILGAKGPRSPSTVSDRGGAGHA